MRTKIEKAAMLTMTLFLVSTFNALAVDGIGLAYSTYIRPILVSLVVLVFIVTCLLNITEFRKGGEAQKEAFIHAVLMAVYPAAVLTLAEALRAILALFSSKL